MSSSVSPVSRNAVLNVFPIIGLDRNYLLDVTRRGAMQFGPVSGKCQCGRYTPSPSVYWNHDVRAKMQFDLLESIVCGQNLVLNGLSPVNPGIGDSAIALG